MGYGGGVGWRVSLCGIPCLSAATWYDVLCSLIVHSGPYRGAQIIIVYHFRIFSKTLVTVRDDLKNQIDLTNAKLELAIHEGMVETEEKMEDEIAEAKKLIKRLDVKIAEGLQEIGELDKKVDGGFQDVNKKVDDKFQDVNKKMDEEFQGVNKKMDAGFREVKNEMAKEVNGVNEKMDKKFLNVAKKEDISKLADGMKENQSKLADDIVARLAAHRSGKQTDKADGEGEEGPGAK